jgi:leucyl-tRNA---protein transferase
MTTDDDYFFTLRVDPEQMDRLWAEGWRHFGMYFFRYRTALHGDRTFHVEPLRVGLDAFDLSRSHRRVLARNRDVIVKVQKSTVDRQKLSLFRRHAQRFKDNVPGSLYDFVSKFPSEIPCPNREVTLWLDGRLVGVTYLDIGKTATSAVYAVFEPEEEKRSLGILMMLESIRYSRSIGCSHYYQGYAYRESSFYDYKKKFSGLERLLWGQGWERAQLDEIREPART